MAKGAFRQTLDIFFVDDQRRNVPEFYLLRLLATELDFFVVPSQLHHLSRIEQRCISVSLAHGTLYVKHT